MQIPESKLKAILTGLLFLSIWFSIALNWYVHMVQKDFTVLTLPDGPDTSDYFESE